MILMASELNWFEMCYFTSLHNHNDSWQLNLFTDVNYEKSMLKNV